MKYDDDTDDITLSSGEKFYAYGGVLGLPVTDDEDGPMSLSHGSDGGVYDAKFNIQERREIADHMIKRWNKWADETGANDERNS